MSRLLTIEARILFRKEVRQLLRSRGAVASSVLLPILLLLVVPMIQLASFQAVGSARPGLGARMVPPGLAFARPEDLYATFLLPLFLVLGGVVVPAVGITHAIVTERETRSLDLLIALPVRVRDILVAKIGAVLILSVATVLPLFAIDAAVILARHVARPMTVLLLLSVLLSALACSTGLALVLTLVARDYRTANNLNGMLLMPLLTVTVGILVGVPGSLKLAVLSLTLILMGVAAIVASVRWLTFERYLA